MSSRFFYIIFFVIIADAKGAVMRYLKVFFLVILFFLVMMFFVQNQSSFADPVALKFDVFFLPPVESIPLPLYSIMLICFALGAAVVLMMLMWDRVAMSTRLMNLRRKSGAMDKKIVKLEGELASINEKHTTEINKVKTELTDTEKRLDTAMRAS